MQSVTIGFPIFLNILLPTLCYSPFTQGIVWLNRLCILCDGNSWTNPRFGLTPKRNCCYRNNNFKK